MNETFTHHIRRHLLLIILGLSRGLLLLLRIRLFVKKLEKYSDTKYFLGESST